ncbi:protein translocase subunit SecD [Labrys monachus]|uniref:Protein translocase subunit SecD n=1 Tax=Labrys monachus TaxID=217067 RepID=A0ABU0FEF4_9HYPH|nr:protein translocase subunit SecD [Labrys monachus]MDQ0392998.1 preprotein translocase subunit SecD [Labrys monachus]
MLHFSPAKTASILIALLIGLWLAAPNVMPESWRNAMPSWLPHQTLTLGLDLQGGSYFLLEIDQNAVIKDQVTNLRSQARQTLIDNKIRSQAALQGRGVLVTLPNPADTARALELLQPLGNAADGNLFGVGSRSADITSSSPGQISIVLTDAGLRERMQRIVERSIEIVRRRVDATGVTEPLIQRQGDDRIVVQMPGLRDPERFKGLLKQTAKLEFRLVDFSMSAEQALQTRPPIESEILYSQDGRVPYLVQDQVMVAGEDLVDAQATFDQQTREPVVSFRFNTNGARQFGRVTEENVNKPFAIVLDNKVLSAPVIREPITGGSGQISGDFTTQQAQDLALLLRSGALPAPMTVVEERTVGPGLGQAAIHSGEMAALVGSLLVVAFMIASYGLFGIIASVAVALNVGLIFGLLSLLGATLTLPGIAGVVLTVGIAVDSNVLIYERIREEVRAGRTVLMSLDAGFARALATILDSNITTFIAAAVLFFVGTGAVKGFAVTLGIGIITTVFTAFTVTRLLVSWWYRGVKPRSIPI